MTSPSPDPRIGTDLGPYRIEAVVGRGGMGVVYRATDTTLDRPVALKVLSSAYAEDAAFRSRFTRESKMAAAIDDPNVLPIYEAGEIDGVLFIAMRYVEGTDLEARLEAGPMSPADVMHVLGPVASALDAAHIRGLVHRDVKPANILIAPSAGGERGDHAYLADFGLTKPRGEETNLTRAGTVVGTLDYMAPEQIEGRDVDGTADQYALTAIAFRALTHRLPFPRDSDVAVIAAHLKEPVPPASGVEPALPVAVDAVIARGMAKDPAARYPSCGAFVGALRGALGLSDTRSIAAAAPADGRRRARLVQAAALAGLVVVAAVLFAVMGAGGRLASTGISPSLSQASAPPTETQEPTTTEDVFPNQAEQELLALLPDSLAGDCEPGLYDLVRGDAGQLNPDAGKYPSASVSCRPSAGLGANVVLVRGFDYRIGGGNAASDFTTEQAVSRIARTARTPGGDCATSTRANGRWLLNGQDAGAIVCYQDGTTGDAVLYWSYPDARVLVKAVNQRGDSAALYDWFEQNARFIAP